MIIQKQADKDSEAQTLITWGISLLVLIGLLIGLAAYFLTA